MSATLSPFLRRVLEIREAEREQALRSTSAAEFVRHCVRCGKRLRDFGTNRTTCSECEPREVRE